MAQRTFIHGAKQYGFSAALKVVIVGAILDYFDSIEHVYVVHDCGNEYFIRDAKGVTLFKVDASLESVSALAK